MSPVDGKLAVIVPTRNRSAYVRRLLSYYAGYDFKCPILVGDSSEGQERQRTARMVQFFSRTLEVSHQIFPLNSGIYETSYRLAEAASTPYVAMLGDDDFLVPRGLEEAVNFLEGHPEYSVAHGMAGLIKLSSPGPYGAVEWVAPYPRYSIEQTQAGRRLAEHMIRHQSIAFSVQRREAFLTSFREAIALGLDLEFSELLTGFLNAIWGKTKQLDCLYMMRQTHEQMTSARGRGAFGWITGSTASIQYERFRDSLARELRCREKISLEQARETVKRAFWSYLVRTLEIKWCKHYGLKKQSTQPRWRQILRGVPGLRRGWRRINEMLPRKANEISLLSLLRPSCRYHADFMPIYRAVTQPASSIEGTMEPRGLLVSGSVPAGGAL